MAKNEKAISAADQLAEMNIGDSAKVNGTIYNRVPGGFVVMIGTAAAFVPLGELACAELGVEFIAEKTEK